MKKNISFEKDAHSRGFRGSDTVLKVKSDTGEGSLYHDTTISKIIKKVENEEGN